MSEPQKLTQEEIRLKEDREREEDNQRRKQVGRIEEECEEPGGSRQASRPTAR